MNDLQVIIHNNERVLTTSRLAEQYGTTERRISENFNANKSRYIEGKHFYCLKGKELNDFLKYGNSVSQNQNKIRTLYLWSEKGALLHAKSLNTGKAWKVYEFLVDNYFNPKQKKQPLTDKQAKTIETEEYHYFDKTYRGEPVITLTDFEHITGIGVSTVRCRVKSVCKQGVDYLFLKGTELVAFKIENPSVKRGIKSTFLLKKSAVEKLLKWFKSNVEIPKCFIGTKKKEELKKKEFSDFTRDLKNLSNDDFINAINVLMAVIYASKGFKKKYETENDSLGIAEDYQKDIEACTHAITRISTFLSLGYGSDF